MIIQGVPFTNGSGSNCGPSNCPPMGADIGLSPCMVAGGQYSPAPFANGLSQLPSNCGPSYAPNPDDYDQPFIICEQLAEPIERT